MQITEYATMAYKYDLRITSADGRLAIFSDETLRPLCRCDAHMPSVHCGPTATVPDAFHGIHYMHIGRQGIST